ncbi:MAG: ABC transporter ATP-binding protein [Nitrososphaerota archaeon]|nr:ABC transporter ATP-binding protein [Nitrososphaerota archaeon]MDG7024139.1 ABC transporter ATP-binding protein [Nitrososphaerota archaeon]
MLKVLNGVNIKLERGEKIGIIGESACGKTTTVKSVMRLLASNAKIAGGEVRYGGEDVLSMPKKKLTDLRRKKMSMVFQDPSAALNPVFTIRQQLYDMIKFSSDDHLSKEQTHEKAIGYLKQAALPEPDRILDSYPFQLSGGMKQRVSIAMALVSANELLLADEPGTSLDVTIEDQIMRLLKQIVEEKGISVVLITHALGTVKNFVDRIYVMYAGTIVEEGPTKEVFNDPQHPYTQMLIRAVPKLTGGGMPEGILGQVPSYLAPPPGCRFITRCPYSMDVCSTVPQMYDVGQDHRVACFLHDGVHGRK